MCNVKALGAIGLFGALLTAACGDSAKSLNPTAPSSVVVTDQSSEGGESSATGKPDGKGKPDDNGKPDDKGKPGDKGKPEEPRGGPPTNTSPGSPVVPTNPITGKVQLEGLISAVIGTSITVNDQSVVVPGTATIRHGSRAVAFSELNVGDRVHVKATLKATLLEATEVKVQNPGSGDGDDDGENADGSVWVTLLDATASESGTDTGTFRLTRSGSTTLPLTSPLTVTFSLTGTALNGTDYQNTPLTAMFLAGQATADVVVTPLADLLAEPGETVVLTLTGVAPYTLGSPTSATVTINEGGSLVPVVSVTASDASAAETPMDLGTFHFTRTGSTASALLVTYTVTGTATNGVDYQSVPVTVTFLAGQSSADVFVMPLADGAPDDAETVVVTLSDGAAYDLGVPATATASVTITG